MGVDALAGALQQAGGELALQPADLLAEGGLHQLQVQRGAADAAELDDADEVPQLAQFHAAIVRKVAAPGLGIGSLG